MKKELIFIGFFVLISILNPAEAKTIDEIIAKIRPFAEKHFGEEVTAKILGKDPNGIFLPDFKKIKSDSMNSKSMGAIKSDQTKGPKGKQALKNNIAYVNEVYHVTRKMRPTFSQRERWLNTLIQGGSREGVYRAIVLDDYYRSLENKESPVNDTVIEFSIYHLSKFSKKGVTKERLEKVNIYTLKRITVEKSLEIMDQLYLVKKEHLYNWYAVFSYEVATKYPDLFKGKVRTNKSKKFHKRWAKAVPEQYLKSEVIIKLHKVFNYLMG